MPRDAGLAAEASLEPEIVSTPISDIFSLDPGFEAVPRYAAAEPMEVGSLGQDRSWPAVVTSVEHGKLWADEFEESAGDISTESSSAQRGAACRNALRPGDEECAQHAKLWADEIEESAKALSAASSARAGLACRSALQLWEEEQSKEAQHDETEPQGSRPTHAQPLPSTDDLWEDFQPQEFSALNTASTSASAAAPSSGALLPWELGAQEMHPNVRKALLRLSEAGVPGAAAKLLPPRGGSAQRTTPDVQGCPGITPDMQDFSGISAIFMSL